MSHIPGEFKYTSTHLWVEILDDELIRAGITDHAQKELGDIVYVELPDPEQAFRSGEECAVVESVKSASDLYCPVSGEVVEVNEALKDAPEKINADPYGDGWIFTLRSDDMDSVEELMDAEAYGEYIEEEE